MATTSSSISKDRLGSSGHRSNTQGDTISRVRRWDMRRRDSSMASKTHTGLKVVIPSKVTDLEDMRRDTDRKGNTWTSEGAIAEGSCRDCWPHVRAAAVWIYCSKLFVREEARWMCKMRYFGL